MSPDRCPAVRTVARTVLTGWLVVVTLSVATPASAGFFHDPADGTVEQAAMRVFLRQADGTVTMIVHTQARGTPAELAWVVPVPSRPVLDEAPDDPFAALDRATAPTFRTRNSAASEAASSTSGCGSARAAEGVYVPEDVALVTVWESTTVGSHDVDVVEAESVEDLRSFLEGHGFPWRAEVEPAMERYVAEGWLFVIARSAPPSSDPVLEPLVMRWNGDELSVPLSLSRSSAAEDMDVLVWIVAAGRVAPRNWTQVAIDDESVRVDETTPGSPLGPRWTNYPDLVAERVDAAADGRGFVTEYAQPTTVAAQGIFEPFTLELLDTDGWLTRLHTRVDGPDLDDDPVFVVQGDSEPVDNYHDLTALSGSPYYAGAIAWAGGAVLPGALIWAFRRRR